MEIFYCTSCHARVSSVDLDKGNASRTPAGKILCISCSRKSGLSSSGQRTDYKKDTKSTRVVAILDAMQKELAPVRKRPRQQTSKKPIIILSAFIALLVLILLALLFMQKLDPQPALPQPQQPQTADQKPVTAAAAVDSPDLQTADGGPIQDTPQLPQTDSSSAPTSEWIDLLGQSKMPSWDFDGKTPFSREAIIEPGLLTWQPAEGKKCRPNIMLAVDGKPFEVAIDYDWQAGVFWIFSFGDPTDWGNFCTFEIDSEWKGINTLTLRVDGTSVRYTSSRPGLTPAVTDPLEKPFGKRCLLQTTLYPDSRLKIHGLRYRLLPRTEPAEPEWIDMLAPKKHNKWRFEKREGYGNDAVIEAGKIIWKEGNTLSCRPYFDFPVNGHDFEVEMAWNWTVGGSWTINLIDSLDSGNYFSYGLNGQARGSKSIKLIVRGTEVEEIPAIITGRRDKKPLTAPIKNSCRLRMTFKPEMAITVTKVKYRVLK